MEFICTDPQGLLGERSEEEVWGKVKDAFSKRDGIAYWRYPLFSRNENNVRKYREPDILIVDKELGIIIIEVKGIKIENLLRINGPKWYVDNYFDRKYISPYAQAQKQMADLIRYFDREMALSSVITTRILIGLPWIQREDWDKKFASHPSAPSVICSDDLTKAKLLKAVENTSPLRLGQKPSNVQWKIMLGVTAGHVSPDDEIIDDADINIQNRYDIIEKFENRLFELDLEQERLGKQIPPGPQRIRGIAGSGKTVILCQRAAHFYLKNPDSKIVIIFFTRSLYDIIEKEVDKWLKRFTNDEVTLKNVSHNIRIFHAWGATDQIGFYTYLKDKHRLSKILDSRIKADDDENSQYIRQLSGLYKRLFDKSLEQEFDAIFIDEGQDLVVPEDSKYENKQTIYWLAWQTLKSIDGQDHLRRLYWAFDEGQSLVNNILPSFEEVLGEESANLLIKKGGPIYKGNIIKSPTMRCCYRTPGEILIVAHTIGMGLLRPNGYLLNNPGGSSTPKASWEELGYQIVGDFRITNSIIEITRSHENSKNPISQFTQESLIDFRIFKNREEEVIYLVEQIKQAIKEGFNPSRHLLIIPLGNLRNLQAYIGDYLNRSGINYYAPGQQGINMTNIEDNRSVFWQDNAVTISSIFRAKGNEALWVFLFGLEFIAKSESNLIERNKLYTAMTRTKAWLTMSGIQSNTDKEYSLYTEIKKAINSQGKISFKNKKAEEI